MSVQDSFVLEVDWHGVDLPSLIGPFKAEYEAREWARLNIPNGSWSVCPLSWPYSGGGLTL